MHRRDILRRGAALVALAGPAALARAARATGANAHAFSFETLERRDGTLSLAEFAGRPVLVVNTASSCGFTPQYEGLEKLWQTYRDRGLMVIGAPSRDFGRQEFNDEGKIRDFCETTFAVDFPLTELVKVKGPEAHPFYRWAERAAREDGRDLPTPRWNFHKYLIGPDGTLAAAWDTAVEPSDRDIARRIEALLPKAG